MFGSLIHISMGARHHHRCGSHAPGRATWSLSSTADIAMRLSLHFSPFRSYSAINNIELSPFTFVRPTWSGRTFVPSWLWRLAELNEAARILGNRSTNGGGRLRRVRACHVRPFSKQELIAFVEEGEKTEDGATVTGKIAAVGITNTHRRWRFEAIFASSKTRVLSAWVMKRVPVICRWSCASSRSSRPLRR